MINSGLPKIIKLIYFILDFCQYKKSAFSLVFSHFYFAYKAFAIFYLYLIIVKELILRLTKIFGVFVLFVSKIFLLSVIFTWLLKILVNVFDKKIMVFLNIQVFA